MKIKCISNRSSDHVILNIGRYILILGILLILCVSISTSSHARDYVQPTIVLQNETSLEDPLTRYGQVLFSPDGKTLVATSAKRIDFWNVGEKTITQSISAESFNINAFVSSSFTNDLSKFIFTNGSSQAQDGVLRAVLLDSAKESILWEIESKPDDVFKNPNSYPGQIMVRYGYADISPSGKLAVMHFEWDADERGVFVADAITGDFIRELDIPSNDARKISDDDQQLLVYQAFGSPYVNIYSLLTGELLYNFPGATYGEIIDSGKQLYTWYPDEELIRSFETQDGVTLRTYSIASQSIILGFQIFNQGNKIIFHDNTNSLHIGNYAKNSLTGYYEISKTYTLIDTHSGIMGSFFVDKINEKYVGMITQDKAEIWLWDLEELGLSGVKQGEEYR